MDTTTRQLHAQIRFALGQLAPLNDHHRFEDLCRQFARLRIASNILVATGPVSAGGDQGRDFETFRSYIATTPIATSTFCGLVQHEILVFACSLQKDAIESKIRSDVSTIVGGGVKPETIYHFCEVNVPVSKRHELQEWAKKEHGIGLEIFDGQTLAEQLTNPDVWWIAQEYLSIPSAVFPKDFAQGGRYAELRKKWLEGNRGPENFADFTEIDAGLRQAMYEVGCRADLPDWITKIKEFLSDDFPARLRRKVQYEIAVASLRGLTRLSAEAPLVIAYFESLNGQLAPAELEDAVVLLTYCSSALLQRHFDIERQRLGEWSARLIGLIDSALAENPGPSGLCSLLQTRGHSCALPFRSGNPEPRPADFDSAFSYWTRLLDQIPAAPLFPLEQFADVLTAITPMVGKSPKFPNLTDRVDQLLEARTSGFVAAEKCRDRAVELYKNGEYIHALKQLQRAKVKWYAAETLLGSLLAMLVVADCYDRLGLMYAAKYYASGVFFLCVHHDDERLKKLAPRAGFSLAGTCYRAGDWLSFLEAMQFALLAQQLYISDPFDLDKHEDAKGHLVHAAILRGITQRLAPTLVQSVDKIGNRWNAGDAWAIVRELSEDKQSPWAEQPADEIWKKIQEEAFGPPFADVGAQRAIRWKALGISWTISFDNTFELGLLAEELAATLQILQADLADTDLCLLPTTADIDLELANGTELEFTEIPDNARARWRIRLPVASTNKGKPSDDPPLALSVAATILGQCSVLPRPKFDAVLESAFRGGLATKAFSIRPAAELFAQARSKNDFETAGYHTLSAPQPPSWFEIQPAHLLKWLDTPGPGYSRKKADRFLRNRYKHNIPPIRLTLPRLMVDARTRSLIRKLRDEDGLRDWQILNIIAGVVVNYRLHLRYGPTASPDVLKDALMETMFREEQPDDPIFPLEAFNETELTMAKRVALISNLKTWDLISQSGTPDFSAVKRFLDTRYFNSTDDIPHEQLLFAD